MLIHSMIYDRANSIFWTRALNIPLPHSYVFPGSLDEQQTGTAGSLGDSSLTTQQVIAVFLNKNMLATLSFLIIFHSLIVCGFLFLSYIHGFWIHFLWTTLWNILIH
jgi:hypothetical protein